MWIICACLSRLHNAFIRWTSAFYLILEFPYFHILKNYYQVIGLFYCVGEKLYEIKILEETHKQEVSRLQKRLQWYAENQELLDKDAARLREANEEAEKLKLEVLLYMPLAVVPLPGGFATGPLLFVLSPELETSPGTCSCSAVVPHA